MNMTYKLFSLFTVVLLLTGCSSAPSLKVKDSKILQISTKPIKQMRVIYRDVEMKVVYASAGQASGTQDRSVEIALGALITKQAKFVFAKSNVNIISARVIGGKTPIAVGGKETITVGEEGVPFLVLNPSSSKITKSAGHTSRTYVFSAVILNPTSGEPMWNATLEAPTTTNTDLIYGAMFGRSDPYGEEYINKLLEALTERLKNDGLI